MPIFKNSVLFKVCLDAEGNPMTKGVPPSKEEIQEAIKLGKKSVIQKEVEVTVRMLILEVLRADLTIQTSQGMIPDPHEDKKYDIYQIITNIAKVSEPQENVDSDYIDQVEFTSENIVLIKARAKKILAPESFGFLVDVLEGKIK